MFSPVFAKFFRLPGSERLVLAQAVFYLAVARLSLLLLPFRLVARSFGVTQDISLDQPTTGEQEEARMLGRQVTRASRHLPWRCACLEQAISTQWMLAKRNLPGTLYFGVAKDESKDFKAHAWLTCGSVTVSGGRVAGDFTVISTFRRKNASDDPDRRAI